MSTVTEANQVRQELDAMKTIYETMRRLTDAEKDRVMGWVSARLDYDRKQAPTARVPFDLPVGIDDQSPAAPSDRPIHPERL